MFRKRGAPVFLELMRGPGVQSPLPRSAPIPPSHPPRPAPSAPAPLFDRDKMSERGPRAVAVETKPAAATPPPAALQPVSASTLERRGRELLGFGMNPWVLVAIALGATLVIYVIAYSIGRSVERVNADRRVGEALTRGSVEPVNDPMAQPGTQPSAPKPGANPPANAPSKVAPTKPAPSERSGSPSVAPAPAAPGPAKLESGMNYLVVATLMKKDADEAAAYLAASGLPTALVPSKKGVDPASAEANNIQWQVLVVRGYASADFRKSYTERNALATQAEALGRKWKAQNRRAPTDFSQAFWSKYEG